MKFEIGDAVRKVKGYTYRGVVVAAFHTIAGAEHYVVEWSSSDGSGPTGMLFIFNPDQLERLE